MKAVFCWRSRHAEMALDIASAACPRPGWKSRLFLSTAKALSAENLPLIVSLKAVICIESAEHGQLLNLHADLSVSKISPVWR